MPGRLHPQESWARGFATLAFDQRFDGPFYRQEPRAKALTFTNIFGKALGGRLSKAELLPVSAIRVGLLGSFAQSVWKMLVKVRAKATGLV